MIQYPLQEFLHIPPMMWKKFRSAMLQARRGKEEVIGFFFGQPQRLSQKKIRYVPQAWIVPSPDCYEYQSTIGLVLKQSFNQYLFDTYLQKQNLDYKSQFIENNNLDNSQNEASHGVMKK